MIFKETILPGAFIINMEPQLDDRGWFSRFYCKKEFIEIEHSKEWVQMNHSFTSEKGTVRGMHYQNYPFSEVKLVKCIAGKVYDVIIDLRPESPTYLKHAGFELCPEVDQMIYIPEGFAHGFQTLENNTALIYHHSNYYTPAAETGIRYNDPFFSINWPLKAINISERDINFKDFNDKKTGNEL
jgi:dTDP-4-dehydrorhamnose 3,5-epimerase